MVTTELTRLRSHLARAVVRVTALTALGVALAIGWPALGGSVAPHPALDGSASYALAMSEVLPAPARPSTATSPASGPATPPASGDANRSGAPARWSRGGSTTRGPWPA